jgi:regulator of cell morphogenesis and NO signaling
MKIEELSLAEIVNTKPAAARIFEDLQLDFCCRGKQKLNEVLSNDQVKLAVVKDRLEKLFSKEDSSSVNFNSLSMSELIDYIVNNHHKYVKENIPVIQQHFKKVVNKHGDSYPNMKAIEKIFEEVCIDFAQHLMKEEIILFPKIKTLELSDEELSSIKIIINVMEKEHQETGTMLQEIRKLSNNYTAPETACITFRVCLDELRMFEEDLHKHVHLENNLLFPKAISSQIDSNPTSCSCGM